jgi:hypothetical protein
MHKEYIGTFKDGWLIGNFEPSLLQTKALEVSYKEFSAGSIEPRHKQLVATEATFVVEGEIEFDGIKFRQGEIAIIPPEEFTTFVSITDSKLLCMKWPSIPSDKVLHQ